MLYSNHLQGSGPPPISIFLKRNENRYWQLQLHRRQWQLSITSWELKHEKSVIINIIIIIWPTSMNTTGAFATVIMSGTSWSTKSYTGHFTNISESLLQLRFVITTINIFKTITILIQAFITCSRKGDWRLSHKAEQNGLVQGHAYTITGHHHQHQKDHHRHCPGLFRVKAGELGTVCLVRVRNPWGDKNEWKGLPSNQTPIDGQKTSFPSHVQEPGVMEIQNGNLWIITPRRRWACTTCI